jgi:hypothetical protein
MSGVKLAMLFAEFDNTHQGVARFRQRRGDRDMDGFEVRFDLRGARQRVAEPIDLGQPVGRELVTVGDS